MALRTLAERGAADEAGVRRLLDAGYVVALRTGSARVADVVAEAGLSNDAFYRHFRSKDLFVAALIEDGAARLRSYLAHNMAKAATPERQVRCWVEGVLDQAADEELAATTRAVVTSGPARDLGYDEPAAVLVPVLVAPLAALGSSDPELDANLLAHAVVGRVTEHLFRGTRPSAKEIERTVAFAVGRFRTREGPARR